MKTLRTMTLALLAGSGSLISPTAGVGQEPAELDDLEMAHVAVTASDIDIAYAHLALALSNDTAIRQFAETMIRDHSAVNGQVVALARRLNVQARDNPLSRQLLAQSEEIKDELSGLRGDAFDRRYAENELAYHVTVNGVVAEAFIPNIENGEVKAAFQDALTIFRGHEAHARRMVEQLSGMTDGTER